MNDEDQLAPDEYALAGWREALGRRLRRVRETLGESQAAFAVRLGVTKLSMLKYEAGKTAPTAELLLHLRGLGLDANYIAFGERSLSSPECRAQFAEVHRWVRRECRLRAMAASDETVMDVAWFVFCKLGELYFDRAPDAEQVQSMVQQALS